MSEVAGHNICVVIARGIDLHKMAVSCFMFLFSSLKLNSMIGFVCVQLQPKSLFCLDWKKTCKEAICLHTPKNL